MYCSKCGKEIESNSLFCKHCGNKTINEINKSSYSAVTNSDYQKEIIKSLNELNKQAKITKSSTKAGILCLLLGEIGIHEFYIGNIGLGIICIFVNSFLVYLGGLVGLGIVGFIMVIRAIILLLSTDEKLSDHYNNQKKS